MPSTKSIVRKKKPKKAASLGAFRTIGLSQSNAVSRLARPDRWAADLELKVDGKPFDTRGREYVIPVLRDSSNHIVIPKAAQMAFTVTFLVRTLHWITERKWNHLYLLPFKVGATSFVQARIDPIIDSAPTLEKHFQRTDNRMHKQTVDNVNLYIRGTNIATELREVPVDCEVWDERDKMVEENLPEAQARMDGSKIQKLTELSTPTAPGHGVDAEDSWHASDMHRWFVPCPHCSKKQTLNFKENVRLGDNVEESVVECVYCHKEITDLQRAEINEFGRWEPTNLDGVIRGYHINQLNSPTQPLDRMLRNFFEGQRDARKLKAFFNNSLGLPYVAYGDQFTPELLDRCVAPSHRLGGIPGGTVFVGVDVGHMLHVKASYISRHGQRMSWAFHIFKEFSELKNFLSKLVNFVCVIDAHPEKKMARDLALAFPGRVFLGLEVDRPNQTEIAVFTPTKFNEAGRVTIDRTLALDSVINEYLNGKVVLPPEAREIGEHMPNLPYNGLYHHLQQMVRVEEEDSNGRIIARWKKNKNPDHWHHADMFEFIATLHSASLVIPPDISKKLAGTGGLIGR